MGSAGVATGVTAGVATVIPYGTGAITDGAVAVRRQTDGLQVTCPSPFIAFENGLPESLRLNGDQYRFPKPPDLRAMTGAAVQMAYLCNHLMSFCDLFAKSQRFFLDNYFKFVADKIETQREPLKDRLAPYGGIYDYRDWMLSAPRPLPRAQLPHNDGAEYAAADFAFIVEGHCLAISLDDGQSPTKTAQRKQERLAGTGAEIITIAPDTDLAAVLPGLFSNFWRTEHLPSSPFRGVTLGEILPPSSL